MGDPKRQRKAYNTPVHPWQKERIESERGLLREYGLKNHKEIWKIKSFVKKAADQAKLIGARTDTEDIQRKRLISRLQKYGLLSADAQVNDVLNIQPKDVLERRLQTMVVRKGLSRTMRQSRQLIVHGHISVNGRKQTSPSYLVKVSEENSIDFVGSSPFKDEDHPERVKLNQGGRAPTPVAPKEGNEEPDKKKDKSSQKEKSKEKSAKSSSKEKDEPSKEEKTDKNEKKSGQEEKKPEDEDVKKTGDEE